VEVKNTISTGSIKVEVIEKILFDVSKLNHYKSVFNTLKESGYIIANDFNSSIWLIKDELEANPEQITFDIEIYDELNNALKGYSLIKRLSGTSKKT
jgi:hypothetical protein